MKKCDINQPLHSANYLQTALICEGIKNAVIYGIFENSACLKSIDFLPLPYNNVKSICFRLGNDLGKQY